jgi:hypothetical protein
LVVAGALALGLAGSAGVAAVVLRRDGSGSARPLAVGASPSAPSVPSVPSASANTRTVEIYAYGRTTVKTLTTVINGQAETVQAPPLPYRRTVQVPATIEIPPVRGTLTWRVAFHCTRGNFQFVVNVDGVQVGGGGQSTTGPEMQDEETSED